MPSAAFAQGAGQLAVSLGGGWAATKIFHIHTLHGIFNLSTWITAIAGAAILLLGYHLITRQSAGSRSGRRYAHKRPSRRPWPGPHSQHPARQARA